MISKSNQQQNTVFITLHDADGSPIYINPAYIMSAFKLNQQENGYCSIINQPDSRKIYTKETIEEIGNIINNNN